MPGIFRRLKLGGFHREASAPPPARKDRGAWQEKVRDPAELGEAATDLPDLPEWGLALSLIDRDDQAKALRRCLEDLASRDDGRALLVIVPGVRSDRHRYFLARCVKFHLEEGTRRRWINLGRRGWWPNADLADVIEKIGEGLHESNWRNVDSLNRRLQKDQRCLCFYHDIEAAHWEHNRGKTTLREWGRIFSRRDLILRRQQLLIAFLGLAFNSSQTAQEELDRLAADWSDAADPTKTAEGPAIVVWQDADNPANSVANATIVVMPWLGKVLRTEVESGMTEASRKLGPRLARSLDLQFDDELTKLFERDIRQDMGEILRVLEPPLRRAFEIGPRPQFGNSRPWQ
jgi:hypothetical protein